MTGRGRALAAGLALAGTAWAVRRAWPGEPLHGQVALVTGGSRGLGFLLARRLVREGCTVAICARDAEHLDRARQRLVRETGGDVAAFTCDVADAGAVADMVDAIVERFGRLDIVVNNAAIIHVGPLETLELHDFRYAVDVACFGILHTTLAALPHMRARGGGRIANVTSIGGTVAIPHLLSYDTAKFAAVGLSDGLRAELAPDGIRVTTLVPGLMRTGSPVHVEYRGRPAREYVWFTLGDLLPLTAMSAERAAARMVRAIRRGEARVTLSWQAKLLRVVQAALPGGTARLMGLVTRLLPDAGGRAAAWGVELRGTLPTVVESALDRAAQRANQ